MTRGEKKETRIYFLIRFLCWRESRRVRPRRRTILFMRTICGIYSYTGRGGQGDRRDPVRYFSEEISLRPEANKRGTRTTDRFILVLAVSLNRSHRWPRAECQIRSRGIYFRRRKRRGSCHFFHKISYNVWRISIIFYVVKLVVSH